MQQASKFGNALSKHASYTPNTTNQPPLGAWNISEVEHSSPRLAYIHINNHQIYLPQESGGYRIHNATNTRQHTAILAEATPETITSLPEECIPADLTITNTYTKL
jgi:hypothetical protein